MGNQPKNYALYISAKSGIGINDVLETLSVEQQDKMLDAMAVFEGFKIGTEVVL